MNTKFGGPMKFAWMMKTLRLRRRKLPSARARALVLGLLLGAFALSASSQTSTHARPSSKTSFFVTSIGKNGGSGNLGGLHGADAHCRSLAEQAGLGRHEWRAYLSTAPRDAHPGIDARDRIGSGPWFNSKGDLIARDIDELHSDRNKIDRHTALTEQGDTVIGRSHDILTGSDAQGRLAFVYGAPATCENWTSDSDGRAMMGHHDRFMDRGARFPRWNRSWATSHPSRGCDADRIKQTGSAGLFYCFAVRNDQVISKLQNASMMESTTVSFKHGLNIAHWLSHNYLPDAPYGAPWFDEEDVSWIAAQGFDHLRLRIAGDRLIDKNGDIDEANIAHIDHALSWAKSHDLGVVLTMLSLPGFRHGVIGEPAPADKKSPFTDLETRYDAEYVWWQLARRYADQGPYLRFELLHRPGAPDAASMQVYNETMLKAIRASNPYRMIYITSRNMDTETLSEVMDSDLIGSDWNIALAFENIGPTAAATPTDIDMRFDRFAETARRFAWGREIYLAEFCGASESATAAKAAAERNGFSWAIYDYQSGCAIRDGDGRGKPTRIFQELQLIGR